MNSSKHLSTKDIPVDERLIFALDVADNATAKALVEELGDAVKFYKIGLELFMGGEYFEMIRWLKAQDKKVFVDLKFLMSQKPCVKLLSS
jgi:orotidine-5'-phosphate decarboxylase